MGEQGTQKTMVTKVEKRGECRRNTSPPGTPPRAIGSSSSSQNPPRELVTKDETSTPITKLPEHKKRGNDRKTSEKEAVPRIPIFRERKIAHSKYIHNHIP